MRRVVYSSKAEAQAGQEDHTDQRHRDRHLDRLSSLARAY